MHEYIIHFDSFIRALVAIIFVNQSACGPAGFTALYFFPQVHHKVLLLLSKALITAGVLLL